MCIESNESIISNININGSNVILLMWKILMKEESSNVKII